FRSGSRSGPDQSNRERQTGHIARGKVASSFVPGAQLDCSLSNSLLPGLAEGSWLRRSGGIGVSPVLTRSGGCWSNQQGDRVGGMLVVAKRPTPLRRPTT